MRPYRYLMKYPCEYMYQYYDSTFQMFEVWYSCHGIFTCVDKFRTLKQAKEYCNKEVEGLEFCGDWPESDRINTTKKLEIYEGYPLVLNEMGILRLYMSQFIAQDIII